LANRTGRPSFETVCEIMRESYDGGVDVLDTAPAYGESEEWIGRALTKLGLRGRMRVVTKLAALPAELPPQDAARHIESAVTQSLKRLGLERVPLCLFHKQEDIRYAGELLALRTKGLIEAAGVSLIDPEHGWKALRIPELKAWQIPTNVLDRRFTHSGLTEAARKAGVVVFVRSVYLQGLILMDDDSTPVFLRGVIPARRGIREIAARFGLPLNELALRAILSRRDVRSVVVGVETVAQIRDNIALVAKGALPAEVAAALEGFEPNLPDAIVSPPEWTKAKAAFQAR
jgi:aryl-alcohol dehydrogenase-like predicted oxidoreductase